MAAEITKILTAEQEAQLLQPIDEYVGAIQEKINALRVDGTDRVVDIQSNLDSLKRDRIYTAEEKAAWIAQMSGVTVGSDAFFPFGDNVERAQKSGVQYIAQPGGSIRDDQVIATANKYGMVMAFTGIRLFHH